MVSATNEVWVIYDPLLSLKIMVGGGLDYSCTYLFAADLLKLQGGAYQCEIMVWVIDPG